MRCRLEADVQRLGAAHRGPGVRGNDRRAPWNGDDVEHARHGERAVAVEGVERRTEHRREARAGVDRAGPLDVRGEHRFAADLGPQIDPRHRAAGVPEFRLVAEPRLRGRRHLAGRRGERADADAALFPGVYHFAVRERELARRHVPLCGGRGEQHLARLRRGLAQRRVPVPHAPRAARTHLPVAVVRVAGSAVTTRTRSRSTPSSSATITACAVCVPWPISVVGECSATSPCIDREIRGDEVRGVGAGGRARGCVGRPCGRQRDLHGKREAAGRDHEFASRQHAQPRAWSAVSSAARLTAASIRGYVPQRQRFPFMPARICSGLGFGVCASSAAACMICPHWQ